MALLHSSTNPQFASKPTPEIMIKSSPVSQLSTEWVDYVEEPMKYQALRPTFSLVGEGGDGVDGSVGVVGGGWSNLIL